MAAASGLLSPTLVKNAMRSISVESEVRSGGSSPLADLEEEDGGWRPGGQQDAVGYIPLAAKRVREVCRRRSRQPTGKGASRPALDSEGDSDISSEGSSGASSLPPSQTSGAEPGRHRSSESSEGDPDDELGSVNLGQLRSSYLTNFDSAKSTPRTTRTPATGVSIKNLKNSYSAPPMPAARTGAPGDTRPRDMSKITVNMASLKSVYSSPEGAAPVAGAGPPQKAAAADLPAGLSLPSIRAAYVQQAEGAGGGGATDSKPAAARSAIRTGVSIDKLRSSWNDLNRTAETSSGDHLNQPDSLKSACMGVSVKALRASYGDLSRLSDSPGPEPELRPAAPRPAPRSHSIRDLDETLPTSPTSLTKNRYKSEGDLTAATAAPRRLAAGPPTNDRGLRDSDVFSRVSVKALRASFCDLSQLRAPASPSPIRDTAQIRPGTAAALRSSFGKEEAADHTRIHVRSFDSSKAIRRFSKDGPEAASSECRSCGRRVFQMESVHAEGAVWHKNCFRCSQCNKPLTVDTYASHEGKLYCVVHHRQLMKPRAPAAAAPATAAPAAAPAPAATEPGTQSAAPDMVGAEEQPDSPPPADIVRASNKADYGLDDLQNLNVKDRFSVFERTNDDDQEKTPTSVEVKRSQSILDKMKKFQGRSAAPDADSTDDSDGSGDEGRGPRDPDTVRSSTKKERPMSFSGLGDVKSRFEGGGRSVPAPDPAKGELAKMRGMICGAREHKLAYEEALKEQEALSESRRSVEDPSLVVQGNLRQTYERAVQEAGSPRPSSREEAVVRGRAADMASRFERGHLETENGHGATQNGTATSHELTTSGEDSLPSDVGSGEPARADSTDNGPAAPEPAAADTELLHSDTTKRMLNKFKQMEQSSGHADEEMSPNREQAQGNARQMLSKFRQLQEQAQKEDLPDGPRPLKSFTPPPEEPVASELEDATEDNEDAEDPDIVRASSKVHDEFLGKRTDQARSLRDKFESWAPPAERGFTVEDDCKPSLEITRNLRAKFESMKEQPKAAEKPTQHRASKFIMEPSQAAETCGACNKRVYAMERLEVDKRILHKNCFRCSKCNCVLRMDTYTFNAGKLFCTPHFKQMFKTKGNYDEGFGLESRTKHWSSANNHSDHSSLNGTTSAAPRPADATDETNGSASVDSRDTNGASPEPELEQEQEQESSQSHQEQEPASDDERVAVPKPEPEHESEPEPEPVHEPEPERGADVFQQVYESTVAGGL